MARAIEMEGDTVERATEAALARLGVSKEDVTVEVVEEEGKSFLGFKRGAKARVRVTLATDPEKTLKDAAERILELMNLAGTVTVAREDEETVHADLVGEDDLGVLIGRRGQTLEALQTVLGVMVGRAADERTRVTIDIEGYRERRRVELRELAERVADKAVATGARVQLRPMTPFERKVVHMALHDNPDVETHSEGEEPLRKVVVEPNV